MNAESKKVLKQDEDEEQKSYHRIHPRDSKPLKHEIHSITTEQSQWRYSLNTGLSKEKNHIQTKGKRYEREKSISIKKRTRHQSKQRVSYVGIDFNKYPISVFGENE